MPTTEKTTHSVDLTNLVSHDIAMLQDTLPAKGSVAVFEPEDSRKIQANIKRGHEIPEGAFRKGRLFDTDTESGADEKKRRYSMPLAHYVTGLLEKITKDGDQAESAVNQLGAWENTTSGVDPTEQSTDVALAVDLQKLEVEAAYDQAVMIEAARQWAAESDAGTLTPEKDEWLIKILGEAQDKIQAPVRTDYAKIALDKIKGLSTKREYIGEEARLAWRTFLHDRFDSVFEGTYDQFCDDEPINGKKLAEMTAVFMGSTGLEMTDPAVVTPHDQDDPQLWTVVHDPAVSSFSVNAGTKTIKTGDRDTPLGRLGFEKLMIHEVVLHAWRAENGSRTGYKAFQKGLPGYSEAEEGLGVLMESLWSGEDPDQLGRDYFRYAAVAYACGVYDGETHNEQETYEFTGDLMDEAGVDDTAELYRHVMRIFRGMPTGCFQRRNCSYLAGKIKMMMHLDKLFTEGESTTDTFDQLLFAKTDPTNDEHESFSRRAKNYPSKNQPSSVE